MGALFMVNPATGQIYTYTNNIAGTPATVATNATGSSLGFGSGLTDGDCNAAGQGFDADGWPTGPVNITTSNTNGHYIQFTITPNSGYALNITSFTAALRRENPGGSSNDGPTDVRYAFSLDGTTWTQNGVALAPLASSTCSATGTNSPWASFPEVYATGTITFRIYGFSSGTNGTGDLSIRNITVGGTVVTSSSPLTFTASGVFQVPPGITCIQVKAWGGGGGGAGTHTPGSSDDGGGGGGGGGHRYGRFNVAPGDFVTISVGTGGTGAGDDTNGGNGNPTTVAHPGNTTILAEGGSGGDESNNGGTGGAGGGVGSGGIGGYAGGQGADGTTSNGGGGGGGAGDAANGGNASGTTAGTGGTASGGNGGSGSTGNGAGGNGSTYGGGGGGASDNGPSVGGNGANGAVIITWPASGVAPDVPTVSASPNPFCSAEMVQLMISGNLNDAEYWAVYTGSCGGTLVGTTMTGSIMVNPGATTTYYVRGEGSCVSSGTCGSVEVVLVAGAPDCTSPVDPYDTETDVPPNVVLEWDPAVCATGYKIYFGTDNPPTDSLNGVDLGDVLTYDHPVNLQPNTTFYWKILPYNANGDATGCPVWSFESGTPVLPDCAAVDYPADGAVGIPTYGDLSWFAVTYATSYKLYFGTDNPPTNLMNGTDVGNVVTYNVGSLNVNATYYWRIVPTNDFGDATDCDVWSFATWDQTCEDYSELNFCTTCSGCSTIPTEDNPDLTGSCADLKIALVLDESTSIDGNEQDSVAAGVMALVNAVACTGVKIAIVEFSTAARQVLGTFEAVDNTLATEIQGYLDGSNPLNGQTYGSGGSTNYQGAMMAVDALPETPDLILYFTDGEPNVSYTTSNPDYTMNASSCTSGAEIENPVLVADKLKCEGAHIFMLGVAGATVSTLQRLSGDTEHDAMSNTIGTSDYAIGNFTSLAPEISSFVSELCPFSADVISSSVCPGGSTGSVSIDIPEELLPFDYVLYYDPGNTVAQSGSGVSSTPLVLTGLAVDDYRLDVDLTVAGSGCTRTETFYFTIDANAGAIDISVTSTTDPTCGDDHAGMAEITISDDAAAPVYTPTAPFTVDIKQSGVSIAGYPVMTNSNPYTATGLAAGTYDVEVTDANGCNVATDNFTLNPATGCCPTSCTVTGDPGDICPGEETVFSYTVDGGSCSSPTYQWSFTANTSGASFVGGTTSSSVTVSSGNGCGTYTLQIEVLCAPGCTLTCSEMVNIVDIVPPVIGTCPPHEDYEGCGTDAITSLPYSEIELLVTSTDFGNVGGAATDVCGIIEYKYIDSKTGTCPTMVTRHWTVTDACGNSDECTQTINIDDTTFPVIATCAMTRDIEGCGAGDITDPPYSPTLALSNEGVFEDAANLGDASDNCAFATVQYIDLASGSCPTVVTRTWYVTDACGNTTSCDQTITIDDTTDPVIVCPHDTLVDCTESVLPENVGTASATDNCTDVVTDIVYNDVVTPGSCRDNYTIARTWTATDSCGNFSQCVQTIMVQDTTDPVIVCPHDTLVDCTESVLPGNVGTASATDNCTDVVTDIVYNDVVTPGSCRDNYTIARTWTATDSCGNFSQCVQTIMVQDTTDPVIVCPHDTLVDCTESVLPGNVGTASATDNCTDVVTDIVYNDVVTPGSCRDNYTIARTWTATDSCGNFSQCVQTIMVQDTTDPVIVCPHDTLVDCTESVLPGNVGTASATDNCTDVVTDIVYNDVVTPGSCRDNYTIARTWTATDSCGNFSQCVQTIMVQDTTDPVIVCPHDTLVDCTESVLPGNVGTASATDNCTDVVTDIVYNDVVTPGSCRDNYTIARTWTATDSCGNFSQCVQTIMVQDTTDPVIVCPHDTLVDCTESVLPGNVGTASATDNCTDVVTDIVYNDVVTPGSCRDNYTIARTWTATDSCGNFSQCVQTIMVQDTTDPVIVCPHDTLVDCTESVLPGNVGTASATDNCTDVVTDIVYNDVVTPGSCRDNYTIARTWTATDSCGNFSQCVQTIMVQDTTDPVIVCPHDTLVDCTESVLPGNVGTASATDNCTDVVTDIVYNDVVTPGSCRDNYTIARTWTATDSCGNFSQCVQTIMVQDTTDPVIVCPHDTLVDCTESVLPGNVGTASATDNCTDVVTDIVYNDVVTPGSCRDNYTIARTWTATDSCGNFSQCVQTIMVQDTTDPVIVCPHDTLVDCTESVLPGNVGTASATDNCTDVVTDIVYNDVVTPGSCRDNYTIARTWTATDSCGNFSQCVQTIMVQDTTDPVIVCPHDTLVDCTESVLPGNVGTASATDNCTDVVTDIVYNDVVTPGSCRDNYTIARTWTATDSCGNFSQCVQTIMVQDTTDPVIVCPHDTLVDCTESVLPGNVGTASATDNCTDVVTDIVYNDVVTPGSCRDNYTIARTWTATDSCGNFSQCVQTIMVQDTTDPVIVCPHDTLVDCTESVLPGNVGTASATDNCTDVVTDIVYNDVVTPGSCRDNYTIARTWTATDSCGNFSQCVQTIMVQDTTDPVIVCPHDTLVDCTESVLPGNVGTASATDNCTDVVTDIVYNDVVTPGSCRDNYTIARTWTATDSCGNFSQCVQTIMVQDTTDPVIVCPHDTLVDCTESVLPGNVGTASATDNCTDVVTDIVYNDVVTPGSCRDNYTIARTWTATDSCGNFSQCVQTIMVQDTTDPVIVCPHDTLVDCTESVLPGNVGTASATDNCTDVVTDIVYNDVVTPGSCRDNYTIARTWTATDSCGNFSQCVQTIMVQDTTDPVIVCPHDTLVDCTESVLPGNVGTASATDNCTDVVTDIVYNDVVTPGSCRDNYTIARTWTATDSCGNFSQCVQTIMVQDTTDPVIVCPHDTLVDCTESVLPGNVGTASATDNCTDVVTDIVYNDVVTPGSCRDNYTIARTWTATDSCGNFSQCVQTIMVQDTTDPVIVCPHDTLVDCTESVLPGNVGTASATDNCTDVVTDIVYNDVVTPGSCRDNYTIARTWTATDSCGNFSQCVQTIMVQDTTDPVIVCPHDTLVDCTESVLPGNVGTASATDNCTDVVTDIVYNDVVTPGSCRITIR